MLNHHISSNDDQQHITAEITHVTEQSCITTPVKHHSDSTLHPYSWSTNAAAMKEL